MIEQAATTRHPYVIRQLTVTRTTELSPGFVRVTLAGPELAGFTSFGPADHAKLFFTSAQSPETTLARDYTPRHYREATPTSVAELDVDFFRHSTAGAATSWLETVGAGSTMAVGGPRGSRPVPSGISQVIIGVDETGLPALARWIELLPETVDIYAFVELDDEADAAYLDPSHVNRARVVWLPKEEHGLERALRGVGTIADDCYVWCASEATALVPVRRYLRRELDLPPSQARVVGYWKLGEAGRDHHAPVDPTDPVS